MEFKCNKDNLKKLPSYQKDQDIMKMIAMQNDCEPYNIKTFSKILMIPCMCSFFATNDIINILRLLSYNANNCNLTNDVTRILMKKLKFHCNEINLKIVPLNEYDDGFLIFMNDIFFKFVRNEYNLNIFFNTNGEFFDYVILFSYIKAFCTEHSNSSLHSHQPIFLVKMIHRSCLRTTKFLYVTINFPFNHIRKIIRIFAIDNLLKYLDHDDIMKTINAFQDIFLADSIVFNNICDMHIKEKKIQFAKIFVNIEEDLFIHNYNNLELRGLSKFQLYTAAKIIGPYVTKIELRYSEKLKYSDENCLQNNVNFVQKILIRILKIIQQYYSSLELIQIYTIDEKNEKISEIIKKSLMTNKFNIEIVHEVDNQNSDNPDYFTTIENSTDFSIYLTLKRHDIRELDLSGKLEMLESQHIEIVFKLQYLETLKFGLSYRKIYSWLFISEIRKTDVEQILPQLNHLSFLGNEDHNSNELKIEEFFFELTNLFVKYKIISKLDSLNIRHYNFNSEYLDIPIQNQKTLNYIIELSLECCEFDDNFENENVDYWFKNVQLVHKLKMDNTYLMYPRKLKCTMAKWKSSTLIISNCSFLTSEIMLTIYNELDPYFSVNKIANFDHILV